MIKAFTSLCPPLQLRVEESSQSEWKVSVQLVNLPPEQMTLHCTTEESAKQVAVSTAYGLCKNNDIVVPGCLKNPEWKQE